MPRHVVVIQLLVMKPLPKDQSSLLSDFRVSEEIITSTAASSACGASREYLIRERIAAPVGIATH